MQRHSDLEELVAGYVLGVLDPEELRAFEAHMPSCPACARQVEESRAVAQLLPLTVPQQDALPELRERVLSAVRAQQHKGHKGTETRGPWRERVRHLRASLIRPVPMGAIIGLLAVAAVSLAVWNLQLQSSAETGEAHLARTYEAIQIMSQADTWRQAKGTRMAPDAGASLATSSRRAVSCLVVWNLPKDKGKHYQAWIVRDGTATNAGNLWSVDFGQWLIIRGRLQEKDSVIITQEPVKGMPQPQGPTVIEVSMSPQT